jgi:predicted O-linked N-acetylglucosamine transferase (SPINDLY family)
MLQRWLGILTRVPNSVLWLWANTNAFEANIKRFAAAHGVDPARLVIAGPAAQPDHLARLALADLFLDSLPYNAHTTASDALWEGVPLITCTGATFAGRVATSLLQAANLPELITTTPQDYEELAVTLANEPQRLRIYRARLSHQRDSCALFDTEAFTRHLESAFTTMAKRARAGLKPQSFTLAP